MKIKIQTYTPEAHEEVNSLIQTIPPHPIPLPLKGRGCLCDDREGTFLKYWLIFRLTRQPVTPLNPHGPQSIVHRQ